MSKKILNILTPVCCILFLAGLVYGLCCFGDFCGRQHRNHNQAIQQYLNHDPYDFNVDQYVSYLGIIGIVVDRKTSGRKNSFSKEYLVCFPKHSTWSNNGTFTKKWCRENALRKRNYK